MNAYGTTWPAAVTELAAAVKLEVDADFAKALPMLSKPALQQGALGSYAIYYQGLAELREKIVPRGGVRGDVCPLPLAFDNRDRFPKVIEMLQQVRLV